MRLSAWEGVTERHYHPATEGPLQWGPLRQRDGRRACAVHSRTPPPPSAHTPRPPGTSPGPWVCPRRCTLDRPVRVAASLTAQARAPERGAARTVGAPTFTRSSFPSPPPLPTVAVPLRPRAYKLPLPTRPATDNKSPNSARGPRRYRRCHRRAHALAQGVRSVACTPLPPPSSPAMLPLVRASPPGLPVACPEQPRHTLQQT